MSNRLLLGIVITLLFYACDFIPQNKTPDKKETNSEICDGFISLMTTSVDEFEQEFRDLPMVKKGHDMNIAVSTKEGIGDFRKYEGTWNFTPSDVSKSYSGSLFLFPKENALIIELLGDDKGLQLKNLFIDCGFSHVQGDEYKKDTITLEIRRNEINRTLGEYEFNLFVLGY
ncbi:MAG: hypothetical protein AAF489_17150 [Bacteroidota bacterium]